VVEDLHWIDASTLEFLGLFIAEGLHDRILTVLTFRPEFRTPWPAVAHQTSLALNRLTRRQVRDLVRQKSGTAVPEALVDQIYDRADGVPLFVEEFTKMVQESAASARTGSGGARGPAGLGHEIPSTLQDLVMARLDRMEGGRDLAQLAAVLGREFSHELLAAVAGMDEPALQAELGRLAQADILYAKGRPPRCNYTFKHALLEDALYNALVKAKRQEFHRRIAEVLEARFPQTVDTQPELPAHHFTEAGLTEQGIGYWLRAGQRSQQHSANKEAIGHLTRGLALLAALLESPARDARELQLLNHLGTAYIASRGYGAAEVGPVYQRARELCERVTDPVQVFATRWGHYVYHMVRGHFVLSTELAAEARAFADRLNDPGMRREAFWMSGSASVFRADFTGARTYLESALAEEVNGERTEFWARTIGQYAAAAAGGNLDVALWHLGYPDQARIVGQEAIELSRRLGHQFSLGFALHCANWRLQYCRLGAELEASAEDQIRIAVEQGFAWWHASGVLFKGAALLMQGRREEALSLLLKGLDHYRATDSEMALPNYLSMLGDAYKQVRRFEDAHRSLDEGLALVDKNDDRFQEAELHRLKGELLLTESRNETAAEECFHRAIETARRQQSRGWELRATMSLARLWQQQGRRDEARAALAAVFDTYTEGFTTPDLMDAEALLKALA
jgi:predicted ATPase